MSFADPGSRLWTGGQWQDFALARDRVWAMPQSLLDRQTGGGRTISEPLFPGADTHRAYHIHKGCGFSGCDQLATADSPGVARFLNSGSCY